MKRLNLLPFFALALFSCGENKTSTPEPAAKVSDTTVKAVPAPAAETAMYIDVHDLEPGKVKLADVAGAHQKDLAAESKYGVNFIRYWVDESKGKVYCLSTAKDPSDIEKTHKEAHGLMPSSIYKVSKGTEAAVAGGKNMFIDVHEMGPGKVTAADVEGAHQKDLAVEGKYGVNFINYYVDEKKGTIMCLSEAADSNAVKKTHKEAHGLMPAYVLQVKQGQ